VTGAGKVRDLFDVLQDVPAAANADPPSSHEAARNITASGTRDSDTRTVAAAVKKWDGKTYAELAPLMGWDKHRVMKRLNDASRLGYVRKGPRRSCEAARAEGRNQTATTWWATQT